MAEKFDPTYPFGRTEKSKEKKKTENTEPKTPTPPKTTTKTSGKLKKILGWSAVGAIGAGAVYAGYKIGAENAAGSMSETPAQVQTVEPILDCPTFNPSEPRVSVEERTSHADVKKGLYGTDKNFSAAIDNALARDITARLQNGAGIGEAVGISCQTMLANILHDATHPVRGLAYGYAQLRSGFNNRWSVRLRDVVGEVDPETKRELQPPRVPLAVKFRALSTLSNLNGYSAQDACGVMRVFGGLMTDPTLGATASKTALSTEGSMRKAAQKTRFVMNNTAKGIAAGQPAHDAVLSAIEQSFAMDSTDPLAFYAYAQTLKTISGKTKTQAVGALEQTISEIKNNDTEWIGNNSGWLLNIHNQVNTRFSQQETSR